MDSTQKIKRKRGQRGPGKYEPLAHVSLRIPAATKEFFQRYPRPSYAMRLVLEDFAMRRSKPIDTVNE